MEQQLNEKIEWNKMWVLKIKSRVGFLWRLWFLISAPIIWLIKGEVNIK